jgi:hypothetical protein
MIKQKRVKTGGRKIGSINKERKKNFKEFDLINYYKKEGLYILKCLDRYKIGISENLYARISTLNTANAFGLDVINILNIKNPLALEKKLHQILKNKKINGREWFLLDSNDINILSTLTIESLENSLSELKFNNNILF